MEESPPCRHCSSGRPQVPSSFPLPPSPVTTLTLPYGTCFCRLDDDDDDVHHKPSPGVTASYSHVSRFSSAMASLSLSSAHWLCPPGWGRSRHAGWRGSVSVAGPRSWRGGGGSLGERMSVTVRAGTSVLTASRVEEGSGYVRVMGPGKGDGSGAQLAGIGRLLVLDEFFEFPSSPELRVRDPSALVESVTYYCDESAWEVGEVGEGEGFRPRHGVRLYLKSAMIGMGGEGLQSGEPYVGSVVVAPVVDHVRDAASVAPTTFDDVAVVKVIAGSFGNVSAGPPLHDFVMLDVQMRPGSEMSLPLDPSFGVLIYILEGVGIFEPNRFEEDKAPFYQNEGHGLYIPPSQKQASTTIRTHEWSQLRFILVGAPTA